MCLISHSDLHSAACCPQTNSMPLESLGHFTVKPHIFWSWVKTEHMKFLKCEISLNPIKAYNPEYVLFIIHFWLPVDICICQIFSVLSQTKFILGKKICLPVKKLRRTKLPLPLLWFAHLAVTLCVHVYVCVYSNGILDFIILRGIKPSFIRVSTVHQRFCHNDLILL